MNGEQTTGRVWNRRRTEKQRRLAAAQVCGKVIPIHQLVKSAGQWWPPSPGSPIPALAWTPNASLSCAAELLAATLFLDRVCPPASCSI